MKRKSDAQHENGTIDSRRRRLLEAAGAGAVLASLGGSVTAFAQQERTAPVSTVRWGVIGTGGIANRMAPRINEADGAQLAAVSSRRMASAKEFAGKHGAANAFDDWKAMIASDVIDAVYIATPTSVREEIGVAAAGAGKHVLGEKPFASLASLQRITAACVQNGVVFMDGTHFPHLHRTMKIRKGMAELTGTPWSVASAFQFGLSNTSNIRLRPDLEPYGAIGDTGWYNMRAAVEYLPDDVELVSSDAYLQRESVNNAVICASGVMRFSDGSTSTWNCGFNSGGLVQDLRITGPGGVIWMDDFVTIRSAPANERFRHQQGRSSELVDIPFSKQAATYMFEDFARMVDDRSLLAASVRASERTQAWLDAAWNSAVSNEA
jgi:predicted dehydrogenase